MFSSLLLWARTGFEFSDVEPSALVQRQGGPCAVIAPVQAFILKTIIMETHGHSLGDVCVNRVIISNYDRIQIVFERLIHAEKNVKKKVEIIECYVIAIFDILSLNKHKLTVSHQFFLLFLPVNESKIFEFFLIRFIHLRPRVSTLC